MAGRIHGDLLSSPTSSSPPFTYPNFDTYSDKFVIPTNPQPDDDEEDHGSSINSSTRTPKIFDRFYDSSPDDEFYSTGSGIADNGLVQSSGKLLDYKIQYLDRKLSSSDETDWNDAEHHHRGLAEFVAGGGGSGIFKVPVRAAVHPERPPSLELRPHPLRESQIGCFLRTLASTDGSGSESQLWAGPIPKERYL